MCLYLRHCKDIVFFNTFQIFPKVFLNKVLFLTDFISVSALETYFNKKKGASLRPLKKKPKTINTILPKMKEK